MRAVWAGRRAVEEQHAATWPFRLTLELDGDEEQIDPSLEAELRTALAKVFRSWVTFEIEPLAGSDLEEWVTRQCDEGYRRQ